MSKIPAYVIISLAFFILTGLGFAYSCFFYPNAHPVDCFIRMQTGHDCPTCGFSRAFSYYTHFQFEQGKIFNPLSWPVFLFFSYQFIFRGFVVVYYYLTGTIFGRNGIISDIIISISFFLLAFLPIIIKF